MAAPRVNLSDEVIAKLSPLQRKELGVKTRGEINANLEAKSEREIQSDCESWLKLNGYWPRTHTFLDGQKPAKGWYMHLYVTKKNPLMLDLFVWNPTTGRCIEVELKTKTGKLEPHQEVICAVDSAPVARSAEEFVGIIKQWETD